MMQAKFSAALRQFSVRQLKAQSAPSFITPVALLTLTSQLACGSLLASSLFLSLDAHAQTSSSIVSTQAGQTLPVLTVTAHSTTVEDLPEPHAGGQVATGARLGALGNVDIMDAPFNITSYTAQVIEDQQARTLADVLSNDPSVRFTTSSGHSYENFRVRGFDVNQNDIAINGMYGLLPIGHTPVEFIERLEVLKGPSALFSGMAPSGAVGGAINIVPKRAGDEPLTRATVGYQSSDQLGTSVDLGRRYGENKAWGVRLNGSVRNGDTEIQGQSKKREFLSIAFDYRSQALKASVDLYSSKESHKGGSSAMFWFASTGIPAAPDPSLNQFRAGSGELDSKGVIARAEYEINAHLSAFASIGAMNHDYSGFIGGSHVRNLNAQGVSTTSVIAAQRGYDDNVSSEAGLRAKFSVGEVLHEFAVHMSNLSQDAGSARNLSAPFTTTIYNPVYQDMPAAPTTAPKTSESTLTSLALMDTISFMEDKLRLTLGLRNQTVKTTNFNAAGAVTAAYDKSAVTPAIAAVFKPWGPGISLYTNYVQGLSKGDSVSTPTYAYNHIFAPYKSEQKEIGIKWNAGTFTHTASLFEITKPMLIMLGGNIPSDGGEKRVRGLEWNTFGEVMRNLRALGGVAYTQGIQTQTANHLNNGKVAVGAPRWQSNLGLEWDTPWVPGLTLNGKVVASSSQYVNSANTQQIPGWSEMDIGARYRAQMAGQRVVLRLNVVNLFDRHYYSGSFSDTTPIATLGQGRTVMASVTMDF